MAFIKEVLETVREDDYVEYFIFPSVEKDSVNIQGELKECVSSIKAIVDKYASKYIWQKDDMNLIPRFDFGVPPIDESAEKLPPHLYGVTHYGDNIEDEWFVVFLLLKATQEIPGIIVRVVDSDGEFLLIEAADHLPNWATPETCEQRVYLYNGNVHLVPKVKDDEQMLEVAQAIDRVKAQPDLTKTSAAVQETIFTRIKGYPECIQENLHSCNVFVPVGVAALLKAQPQLVAPAVIAFCHRDPIDLKACRAMRYFPPEHRVLTRVVFTKCLYAMLAHQKYLPDRRTGWKLPSTTDSTYQASLLGVKLACGFEILVSQCKSSGRADDLGKDWQRYKQSLTGKGYFKDLLEGSQEYTQLEQTAREYFESHSLPTQPSTGQLILDLLREIEIDEEALRKGEASLPPPDDDSWLDVSQAELEQMLEQRYGCKPTANTSDISSKLASFLSHVSSLEGAEFPQEGELDSPPVRPRRGVKPRKQTSAPTPEKEEEDGVDNRVSFDHEAFSCAVQNILDFVVPEDNWDMESEGSGMSSYEDEVDMDLGNKGGDAETPISELKQYMDQMDRELASTDIGKSFDKVSNQTTNNKKVMEDSFSEVEHFEPVDIDMNALKNILESYQAQMGGAGPASNLLGPMGVRLDDKQ